MTRISIREPGISARPSRLGTRLLPLAAILLLTGVPFGTVGAQQQMPVVNNGRRGSMRTAPTLTEQAQAGAEGPEESLIYTPGDLLFGPDGNLYVPDSGNKAIMVYDLEGKFIRRIGKEGAGPGELRSPAGVYFNRKRELVVPDPMNQRTSYFGLQGEFLRSNPMGQNGMIMVGPAREPLGDGTYIQAGRGGGMMVMMRVGPGSGGSPSLPDPEPIQILDEDGKVLRGFGIRKEHEDQQVVGMLNTASMALNRKAGEVALAYRYTPDITVYDLASGEPKRTILRELPFTPVQPKMDMVTGTGPEGRGTTVRMSAVGDVVTHDATYDGEGRLWTITSVVNNATQQKKDEDGDYSGMVRLEIFDPAGQLLATIPLEDPANQLAFDPNGNLWLLDSQYLGTLKKYQVRWP